MKYNILLSALAIAAATYTSSCNDDGTTTTTSTDSVSTAIVSAPTGEPQRVILSEADSYIDLKTGKTIRIRRDTVRNVYVREDMTPLDIYVNTSSMDTFWGPEAVPVNNALIRDESGMFTVDELRVERNGDGYKAKSEDGEIKIKENENELKMKDGDAKIKVSDDEYKYKDGDTKIKSNDKETKIKTRDSKTEIDHRTGEVKTRDR
jgi:hypothetical protein